MIPGGFSVVSGGWLIPVSYTHLDVYKRQVDKSVDKSGVSVDKSGYPVDNFLACG